MNHPPKIAGSAHTVGTTCSQPTGFPNMFSLVFKVPFRKQATRAYHNYYHRRKRYDHEDIKSLGWGCVLP